MHETDLSPVLLALTDEQITHVMQLSRPLQPDQRVTFFEMIAAELAGQREPVGDGQVHRLCAELLRRHRLFDPPDLGHPSRAKYDR